MIAHISIDQDFNDRLRAASIGADQIRELIRFRGAISWWQPDK